MKTDSSSPVPGTSENRFGFTCSVHKCDLNYLVIIIADKGPSEPTFYKVWQHQYSNVKIPKTQAFTKCTKCCQLKAIIRNAKNEEEKELAKARLRTHWSRVTKERQYLNYIIAKSQHDPNLFFCEIDGMDSNKTHVVRTVVKDKDTDPDLLLKVHVTGVKYNGTRPDSIYLYTDAFPHDSANTCTVMYMEILKVLASVKYERFNVLIFIYVFISNIDM